jgi:hypothetical protein
MPPMAHFSKSLWRPHNHVMWYKKTYKTTLPKSTSTAQQHCGYLIDYHQSQVKQESRRMKTSTIMANHDPMMNRINPKYHALLGIAGTWSTWCDFLQLFVDRLVWFLMLFAIASVSLEWVLLPCACACFWPSALKILRCVEPGIISLSRICFSSHPLMSARVAFIKWS